MTITRRCASTNRGHRGRTRAQAWVAILDEAWGRSSEKTRSRSSARGRDGSQCSNSRDRRVARPACVRYRGPPATGHAPASARNATARLRRRAGTNSPDDLWPASPWTSWTSAQPPRATRDSSGAPRWGLQLWREAARQLARSTGRPRQLGWATSAGPGVALHNRATKCTTRPCSR